MNTTVNGSSNCATNCSAVLPTAVGVVSEVLLLPIWHFLNCLQNWKILLVHLLQRWRYRLHPLAYLPAGRLFGCPFPLTGGYRGRNLGLAVFLCAPWRLSLCQTVFKSLFFICQYPAYNWTSDQFFSPITRATMRQEHARE